MATQLACVDTRELASELVSWREGGVRLVESGGREVATQLACVDTKVCQRAGELVWSGAREVEDLGMRHERRVRPAKTRSGRGASRCEGASSLARTRWQTRSQVC